MRTLVFFHIHCDFIHYWVSGVRLLNSRSCRYVDSTSLSILKISSEFLFDVLWNNRGTNLSSSYLSYPTEENETSHIQDILR